MFKKQIEELFKMEEDLSCEIEELESDLKSRKFKLRDVKAGLASLIRLQDKQEEELKEVMKDEECSLSI